jgi:phage tail-like protein
MPTSSGDVLLQKQMWPGFRFLVTFFAGGVVPNPLDIRFKRVSGLTATVKTQSITEGGQNLYSQKLPESVEYDNLVLERGMVLGSPLNLEFDAAMSLFKFAPSNVMVVLLSEDKVPVAGWTFIKAYPVRWSTSDLNADSKEIMIDTLELAYARMQIIRI